MAELRQRYLDQIEALQFGSPALPLLHTKLKVLTEVVGELRSIAADPRLHRANE